MMGFIALWLNGWPAGPESGVTFLLLKMEMASPLGQVQQILTQAREHSLSAEQCICDAFPESLPGFLNCEASTLPS
jgi:hypothetical protein